MSNTELDTVTNENKPLSQIAISRLDDSLFSKELAPHYMKLAGQLASSDLVPKSFRNKPQDLFICWAMGYQVGLTPEQSMQCIAVINGKPAMWGDDMLALCMSHKDFVDIQEEGILNKDGVVIGFTCTVLRAGMKPKVNEFTLDMAKRAGLLAKGGVWAQYPERMLKLRARGFSLRDAFPDALKGIKPREEVEDYIDAEYRDTTNNKNLSRTELLKQDILKQKGAGDAGEINGLSASNENKVDNEETAQDEEKQCLDEARKTTADLHIEIKKLCDEVGITDERIQKALKFYETKSIDELDEESCQDFINKLKKI